MNDIVRILGVEAYRDRVHVAEELEEEAFTLYDRKGRTGSYVGSMALNCSVPARLSIW
ncbi:MAG: hypothetical protein XD83_1342 [Synergistales bacterium 57_84]|nr:MAG: hypothetical protein XD83_1342 [Synergistales bacterium 57_84]